MKIERTRLVKVKERRQKVKELALRSPGDIEKSVLPTVTDIYSHPLFSRTRKEDLPD